MDTFLSILKLGIHLVVLTPVETEYTWEGLDMQRLFLFVVETCRGHGESECKSEFSSRNWREKRKAMAEGKTATRRMPCWVSIDEDGNRVANEKADVIRLIFELSAKGFGGKSIQRELVRRGIKPIGKGDWHYSTIGNWLMDRSVLGECRPKKLVHVDGVRRQVPTGEVIPGYYPQIISLELWHRVQAALKSRKTGDHPKGGRPGENVSNLFTGLAFDEKGAPLSFLRMHNRAYLQSFKGGEAFRYTILERVMISCLVEISVSMGPSVDYQAIQKRKDELDTNINVLKHDIAQKPNLQILLDQLDGLISEQKELDEVLKNTKPNQENTIVRTQNLIQQMRTSDNKEEIRRELKGNISRVLQRIDLSQEPQEDGSKKVFAMITFVDSKVLRFMYIVPSRIPIAAEETIEIKYWQIVDKDGDAIERLVCMYETESGEKLIDSEDLERPKEFDEFVKKKEKENTP